MNIILVNTGFYFMLSLTNLSHFAIFLQGSVPSNCKKYLAMQTVLVLFVQVFTYLSMRLLFPHQYNGGEWNLICDAHTIEN